MIDELYKIRIEITILVVVFFQLLNASCSKQIYTQTSIQNIETPREKKDLENFMSGSIGKKLITYNTSADEIITSADEIITNADEIINTAKKYLGVPHCMGGTTMKCMDCSGLLVTVFANHGIKLPHNAEEQSRYGKILTETDKLSKGDLVFFIGTYNTNYLITHSGIYIGNNQFIHASTTKGVTITSMNDPWWSDKYIFATRILED